ncbi:hypothetical protein LL3_00362 [Bacillus amyloliquefaciens LL3]|nr:hypothetical protein LL3_00362 [Bacillus amyloliquefaciens LL3]
MFKFSHKFNFYYLSFEHVNQGFFLLDEYICIYGEEFSCFLSDLLPQSV